MTHYGKITHYDAHTGSGMIAPEQGGDPLPFDASSLQQQGEEPRSDQLYTFDTRTSADGHLMASNLQMEQGANARQQDPQAHGNQGGFDAQGQSQNRHNQDAASRPGVDQQTQTGNPAHHDLEGLSRSGVDQPERQSPGSSPAGGSTFQPLEADSSKAARSPERQHDLGRNAGGDDGRQR